MPREVLCEGPAGTGKTWGILAILHTLAWDYPNLRILICRQTRASLTESVLATFEDEVLPADGRESIAYGERRDHRSAYRYSNGSRIVLGGLDKPERLFSTAWDLIFINEAIEAEEGAWETLKGRQSRPGRDRRFGYLIGDTNPGDPSHWLNQRCEAGRTARWQTVHAANPALFGHEGWLPVWEDFKTNLSGLTGTRRKRFYLGIWAAGEGAWFNFDPDKHVTKEAEFHPGYPVYLAVDTGLHTGAVWYQIREEPTGTAVTVFGDFYDNGGDAFTIAGQIQERGRALCGGRFDVGRADPSGGNRVGFGGSTILGEFARAGLNLAPWLKYPGCQLAGLGLLESFIATPNAFRVHPRCSHVIMALQNYQRAKRGNQYVDEPIDPQHPHEDFVDPIRSSLLDKFPEGRRPMPLLRRVHRSRVF